jgi:solute carrier family 13 (sodium-dependent dicarboxylate transporter), member 2/3/5
VLMLAVMWLVLRLLFRSDVTVTFNTSTDVKPWTSGEKAAAAVFVVAVIGWTLPGVLEAVGFVGAKELRAHLPEEVVAVLGAVLLMVWPLPGGKRALSWDDAARIDWGTPLLFGGGILLGTLANKSGLVTSWGETLAATFGAETTLSVVALSTVAALLVSEVASNTAAATLILPLAQALAVAAHVPVLWPVLGAMVGASFGFMMPISTAPNAMAYASGVVRIRDMVRAGVVFDVIGAVVVIASLGWLMPRLLSP